MPNERAGDSDFFLLLRPPKLVQEQLHLLHGRRHVGGHVVAAGRVVQWVGAVAGDEVQVDAADLPDSRRLLRRRLSLFRPTSSQTGSSPRELGGGHAQHNTAHSRASQAYHAPTQQQLSSVTSTWSTQTGTARTGKQKELARRPCRHACPDREARKKISKIK